MMTKPARTPGTARWSLADVILIDEATDVLQRTPSLGHVILDEAQDLSPMQLRAVGRRASTGSVTVLGDLAQATTPWATSSWQESLTHLVRNVVNGALKSIPPKRRADPDVVDAALQRAVRGEVNAWWGKKPNVTVFVHRI